MSLYLVGKACFFEHEDYGLIALPCSNGSEYNLFYEPTRINAFSFGFTRTLSFGEFELVRNNPTGTPTALTVYTYIKRMMDVLRSIDVVCARMKRPYLILCEEKQKLTFINLLKRIKDNEDIVLAFKNYGIDKSNFEVAPLPSIGNIDQLWKTYRTYEDILYSAIGLDSKGDDKKERLLVDEVNANNMVTEMANEVNLKQLRLDIEKVNRRYGTNIEVDIKSYPPMIMTAALEVGQVSRYTMELGKLVGSGYEIFDDSWTTFVEMHKKELCDKIIRHYFFCEIGQETPDRFKHYLNEHLARIMPYYNQLTSLNCWK